MRQSGFTLVESLISTAMLSVILISGVVVTRSAMLSSERSLNEDGARAGLDRLQQRAQQYLRSASRATLLAVPTGGTKAVAMVDGVTYNNIEFRRVVGFAKGAVVYQPPVTKPPYRIYFQAELPNGSGSIYLDDGVQTVPLVRSITAASFTKSAKRITLDFSGHPESGCAKATARTTEEIVLRVP